MIDWPKQDPASMNAFYGNPDRDRNGQPDASWVRENIVQVPPPFNLYYPIEVNGEIVRRSKHWKSFSVHRKFAPTFQKVLSAIPKVFTAEEINRYELDLCGGVFVFRLKRGGVSLSMHSWGSAFDLSHLINYYGAKYSSDPRKKMMPKKFVDICLNEGLTWGGMWRTGDAMHFQGADL